MISTDIDPESRRYVHRLDSLQREPLVDFQMRISEEADFRQDAHDEECRQDEEEPQPSATSISIWFAFLAPFFQIAM